MDPEGIVFSNISQAGKDKHCMILLLCGIYEMKQMNKQSKVETDP